MSLRIPHLLRSMRRLFKLTVATRTTSTTRSMPDCTTRACSWPIDCSKWYRRRKSWRTNSSGSTCQLRGKLILISKVTLLAMAVVGTVASISEEATTMITRKNDTEGRLTKLSGTTNVLSTIATRPTGQRAHWTSTRNWSIPSISIPKATWCLLPKAWSGKCTEKPVSSWARVVWCQQGTMTAMMIEKYKYITQIIPYSFVVLIHQIYLVFCG